MSTIYNARSVNPDQVTAEQLAEVFAEHGVTLVPDGILNFFKPGRTYRRGRDTFRCAAVGTEPAGRSMALGYMPVNLSGTPGWEVMWQISADWPRWTEACGNCQHPFDPADRRFDGAAEYDDTGFCRGCIDNCHEAGIGHRCNVCKALTERSSQ